jgi:hypothetical protein
VAWLPSPGDDLIPVLLSVGDIRTIHDALSAARDRWAQAANQAQADAQDPDAVPSCEPGRINVEPTPAGYRGIARIAADQQTRYDRVIDRLDPIVQAAQAIDDTAQTPAAVPNVATVVLIGISATFTPPDLEALVITAAEAVYGQPDDLSSRQRKLAARAYDLLQDAFDD